MIPWEMIECGNCMFYFCKGPFTSFSSYVPLISGRGSVGGTL